MKELAERFVPAADEVWRLQNGKDPECTLFQAMANQGHYRRAGGTRQGIYVCTPGGEFLASLNSNSALAVRDMMERGWTAWEALADEARGLDEAPDAAPDHRWESSHPSDGLVLVSTCRDLPRGGEPPASERWNRDHVWFSREEARAWLPEDPQPGASHELPRELALRLARFHLVDNVKGQAIPFAAVEISRADFQVTVLSHTTDQVQIEIRGQTRANAPGPWQMEDMTFNPNGHEVHPHGLEAELLGRATYDLEAQRFTRFEMVARGSRWGFTQNNGRRGHPEPSPLGFHFLLAERGRAERIPPAFLPMYRADWVLRPERPIR